MQARSHSRGALLGLVLAHLELEEAVLFPILERAMEGEVNLDATASVEPR